MGLGGFIKRTLSKPISKGLGSWGDLALNLFMYKKRRDAIGKGIRDNAHSEHAKRMRRAQQQLSTLTQNYHRGGVKMAGTPSVALGALERKNVGDIDGYLNGQLRRVRNMRSVTRATMLGMILKQHRRKLF